MSCEAEQAQVTSLNEQLQAARTLASQSHGADRAAAFADVKELTADLATAKKALADCQAANPPAPVLVAPREILEINWTNPAPPDAVQDWATQIVGGTKTFPTDGGPNYEWLQVLDPQNEYDDDPVGATGWVVLPEWSAADFPFSHPFGYDFEFSLALDVPRPDHPGDSNYLALLAPGNSVDTKESKRAEGFGLPSDVLGVEMDGGLVPSDALPHEGDRVAVFGRWIIDTGHYHGAPSPETPAPGFRTEIHPPLLMASANTRPSTTPSGFGVTRAVFTSRPYLVGQTFGRLESVDKDGIDDDGAFNPHMHSEVAKVLEDRSFSLEAHPKIKSQSFRSAHLFHFIVRPPAPPPPVHHGVIDGIVAQLAPHLVISFNFTVRTGCSVEVTSDGAAVNVFVAMNGTGYVPPALPVRSARVWTREDLERLNSDSKSAFDTADMYANLKLLLGPLGLTFGSLDGVETDTYDTFNAPVLHENGAVSKASPMTIPAGQGISTDNSQPFPITGWIEAEWQATEPTVLAADPGTTVDLGERQLRVPAETIRPTRRH
jgi:hypothetical protein